MLALALPLVLLPGPTGQDTEFTTGPAPEWVERAEIAPLTDVPTDEIAGGIYSVLADTQDSFVDGEAVFFTDYAWYVHDTQGVQNGSQVSIDFDPSYQRLTIHTLEVIRDGETIDRLNPESFQVVQREEELDYKIYDGSQTALVFLEDIRPGDIVRQSYTLEGSNPAFEGHYVRSISLASSSPLRRIRHRLLWPIDRALTIRYHGARSEPRVTEQGAVRDYRWEAVDVPAVVVDDPLPSWYFAVPWIQFTSFEDWNEVARLETELLARPAEISSELAADIEAIRAAHERPQERAQAAVRFVQDDVRYLGIELGAGAYRASAPDDVHARRFGDCKDKSLLLATMLGELGIDSRLGLVSTSLKHTVGDYAPSLTIFDHVIVRVDLPDGPYWIDPTESLVGGDLRSYEPPPLGMALVVDEATTKPEPITNEGTPSLTRIQYRFGVGDVGTPTSFEVVTEYIGRSANDFRETYGWTKSKYTRQCLDYYASYYDSVRSLGEVEVEDDRDANVMRTTERYEIPEFWKNYDGDLWAELWAPEIDGILPELTPGSREHPLRMPHPVRYEHSLVIELREAPYWWFEPESRILDNAGFRFTFDSDVDGSTLRLDYTFQSKADSVPAEAAEEFIDDLGHASDLLGYDVPYDDVSLEAFAAIGAALLVACMTMGALMAIVALRSISLQRERTFEEVVADATTGSPWFTMWARPRATMRAILDSERAQNVLGKAAMLGVISVLDQSSAIGLADNRPLYSVLGFVVVGGAFFGIIQMYLSGWVLGALGRLMGGKARAWEVRAAYAWSSVITIWFGLTWVPALLLFGQETFTIETPRIDDSLILTSALVGLGAFNVLAVLWGYAVFLKCLAEAHRFPIWKAFLTTLPFVILAAVRTVALAL